VVRLVYQRVNCLLSPIYKRLNRMRAVLRDKAPHEVGACLDRFLFQAAVHGMVMPATEHNSFP